MNYTDHSKDSMNGVILNLRININWKYNDNDLEIIFEAILFQLS